MVSLLKTNISQNLISSGQNNFDETINDNSSTKDLFETDQIEPIYNENDDFVPLIEDSYFDKPKEEINKMIENIENNFHQPNDVKFDKQEEINKLIFVQTKGAKERLQKIASYIKVNIPVLLEGPTGTSKTLSSEIVCIALGKELIRFNLSSETKTQDLIGRYIGDDNSWAGISMKDGPFFEAFTEGKVLLLDEINLASPSVLQCIEEALDSEFLSIEIPGRPLQKIKMNPDFRLIATQNPNKGLFTNKRQNLGFKFYSRFQIVSFPALSIDELQEIGLNLAKKFNYNDENVVKDLISFHKEWSDYREKEDDPQCFTIREIAATVHALGKTASDERSVYDTIMSIYGDRYQKELKDELINTLNHYPSLINDSKEHPIPHYPFCFMNKSLKSAIKSIDFSFKNNRSILLTGKSGCGKTQLAIWASEHYNMDKDENEASFFCVCTEEIKVADLVGHSTPSVKIDGISPLIVWQDGFMTEAIKKGKCCVLESLDEAPATVTERLNELLDEKYDGEEKFFYIPESSECSKVPIDENFRILATCNIEKLSNMSPALLNRFDIIVLDDQIDDNITEEEFNDLIKILIDKYYSNLPSKSIINDIKQNEDDEEQKTLDELLYSRIRTNEESVDDNSNNSDSYTKNEYSDENVEESYEDNNEENSGEKSENNVEEESENTGENSENNIEEESENAGENSENNVEKESENLINFENIIPILYDRLKNEKNISYISKICKATVNLYFNLHHQTIQDNEIVDLAFSLFENPNSSISEEIENKLLDMFQKNRINNDSPFFYLESPSLKTFLAKLMSYSIIEQPVCITGPTGIGKTSASRAFSMMRPCKSSDKFGFQFHSFHSGTKASHFFGTTTLYDGKIQFHDGTLTTALKNGLVFIADEFNLSPQSVMKTLSLALDPTVGRNVFIPGIGRIDNISPNFFFIACQNEIGTIGRNAIPDTIAQRLVEIEYPKPEDIDIINICIDIAKDNLPEKRKNKITEDDINLAKSIGSYMLQLNNLKLTNVPQWSLRDITKLFRRIYGKENDPNFYGMTPYHLILFYTLSAVPPKDAKNVINSIKTAMKISFVKENKPVYDMDELVECYNAIPEIKKIEDRGLFLMKKDFGISIDKLDIIDKSLFIDKVLPSLWNAAFHIILADEREPILLMGNSGFKTFLASKFLPSAQTISLNEEATVAQLLGTSGFMTSFEAKLFYIEYICKILQINTEAISLKKILGENNELLRQKIEEYIQEGKKSTVPQSLYYALDHLSEKLFNKPNEKMDESILSDTILEFRPGLFLDAILQRQSLILKDLSNLQTIVLERFNELFSGKQNITLSEDIHDTFTPNNSKELTDFNAAFHVIATCPEDSPTKLSEAVLSRFTVIAVSEYQPDEQEVVLKGYAQLNNLFVQDDIARLKEFSNKYEKTFNRSISFPQMIKIVELTSQINKFINIDDDKSENYQIQYLGLILYRYLGGLMDSNVNKKKLVEMIKELFDLPKMYQKIRENDENYERCQLVIDNQNDSNGVLSRMSNLFLRRQSAHESQTEVAFTPSFNDLIDLIHLSITIHNPIILEGPPGQGKHTAINYIAEMLDMEVIQITITQSTKVEDLFGKETISRKNDKIIAEMIETEFVNNITESDNFRKSSLIILDNINNASPAVLNALVPVFSTNSTRIFLPNGKTIEKGIFNIIGIFNSQQISTNKDKLPSSLINSSIYHIVSKSEPKEIYNIILTKFKIEKFSSDEAIRFNDAFTKARNKFSNESSSSELFALNDIQKYISFRSLTRDCFDEKTILQMIFVYRFSTNNMIKYMRELLKLGEMKFNPIFSYNVPPNKLFVQINHSTKNDKEPVNSSFLSVPSNCPDTSILSKIDSLTLPQKHCLIFLICSLLSKRACVVQGDTASGKSYIIRLFSELIGKELICYQMNADSNISMFVGQSVLDSELNESDIKSFKKELNDLYKCDQIKEYIDKPYNNIDINNSSSFRPKSIKNLLEFIKSIESSIKTSRYWPEIQQSVRKIKEKINPLNRFQIHQSEFINAMKKGYWVLIDGIESAPSSIAEKIASLCGENPELNLYEFGPKLLYSTKSDDPNFKIHEDFHLFITYNPYSLKEYQVCDQSFLTKSFTFTLPQIDDDIQNSAQILFGSLLKKSYPNYLSKELASRLAVLHKFAKDKSQEFPDNFVGDYPFHGRILSFEIKLFNSLQLELAKSQFSNIKDKICLLIDLFYANSCSNKLIADSFRLECIEEFKKEPDTSLITNLQTSDTNLKEKNKPILISLRNIQKNILQNAGLPYSLSDLLENLYLIKISDVFFIQKHIKSTIKLLKSKNNNDLQPMIKYGSLYIFSSIFKKIMKPKTPIQKEHTALSLNDKELRNDKGIASHLLKLDLLYQLVKNNYFSEDSSILLENSQYSKIISIISFMIKNKQKNSIKDLFSQIRTKKSNIDFIVKIFPYLYFKDSSLSLIIFWLPLTKTLIDNKVRFTIIIDDQTFEFNHTSKFDFKVKLEMAEKNNLKLSKGSKITFNKNKNTYDIPQNKDILMYYFIDNLVSSKPSKKSKKNDSFKILQDAIKKANAEYKEIGDKSPLDDKILSLKYLFNDNENNISLISLIWNIVFTLKESEIIDLSQIINPVESKILLAILKMYDKLTQKRINTIISWNKWAECLEKYTKTVLSCILKQNKECSNIESLIRDIQDEIRYLKGSPDKKNKFWDSKEWIDICEAEHDRLIELNSQKKLTAEKIAIKKKIDKIKNELNNNTSIKEEYHEMKNEIVKLIGSIDEYTEQKYKYVKSIVKKFINDASSSDYNIEKTRIIWPFTDISRIKQNDFNGNNIKLFNSLIWYSQVNSLIEDIENKKDIIPNLRKLSNFQEMECSRELILTNLIKNSKNNSSDLSFKNEINNAKYSLQANMIVKLYNIDKDLIKNQQSIYNTINKYANRNTYDKNEIPWIYQTINDFSSDFLITMPIFSYNSLVFLFVNKIGDKECQTGPLCRKIKNIDQELLSELSNLMYSPFKSFCDAAGEIATIIYQFFTSSKERISDNYEEIKRVITSYKISTKSEKKIMPLLTNIFDVAESFDKWAKSEKKILLFDDTFFLSENWDELSQNKILLNKYPSLMYWIYKNDICAKQLMQAYNNFKFRPNSIPLWLVCLRIISSTCCINFSSSQNKISNIINDAIVSKILLYVKENSQINNLNYNWLNLLVSNLPQKITNNDIKIIHDFLLLLSFDNNISQSTIIQETKQNCIKKSISQITDSVLEDEFCLEKLDDSLTQFLCYPSKYMHKKIDNSLLEISKSIITKPSIEKLKKLIIDKRLTSIVQELSDTIKEENCEYKEKRISSLKKEMQMTRADKIIKLQKKIDEYCLNIHNYKRSNIKELNDRAEVVNALKSLEKELNNYPEIFKEKYLEITYIKYKNDVKIVKKAFKKKVCTLKNNNSDELAIFYLLPNEKVDKNSKQNVEESKNVSFKLINKKYKNNSPNVANVIKFKNIDESVPVLLFANHSCLPDEFLNKIEELDILLNDLNNLISIIENDTINSKKSKIAINFEIFQTIIDKINDVGGKMQVEFSNGDQSIKTKQVVQEKLKIFLDDLYNLIDKSKQIFDEFNPIWNIINSKQSMEKIFQFDYDIIKISKIKSTHKTPNFSKLKKIDSLASPIFYLTHDNEIICSISELKCLIGPIFPSLSSSKPISINLMSFIQEKLSITIDQSSNPPQNSQLLTVKEELNNSEPIQIFVKTPEQIDKLITITGKLKIKSKGTQTYKFPYEIKLKLMPLKMRIQSLQYHLFEIKRNYFRLCCNCINSCETINFELINFYIHNKFLLSAVELEALNENQADQPIKKIDSNLKCISLTMPQVKNPTRSQFDIIIKFAQNFESRILCDFVIRPYIFKFEVYDYFKKEFVSNICPILTSKEITQKLHFRVFVLYPIKMKGKINYTFPDSIKIIKMEPVLNNSFDINGDFTFSMEINMQNDNHDLNNKCKISLEIENDIETIKFYFVDPNSAKINPDIEQEYEENKYYYLSIYPCYSYRSSDQKWTKIRNEKEMNNSISPDYPYIITTPFKYYSNFNSFTELQYNSNDFVNATSTDKYPINYIQVSTEIEDMINISNTAQRTIDKKKNISHYSIIGYLTNDTEKWFPVFSQYPNESYEPLPYETNKANIDIANKNINLMFKYLRVDSHDMVKYLSSNNPILPVKQTNSSILLTILLKREIILNINTIINCMPKSIRNQFNNILDEIQPLIEQKEKIDNELVLIISHNLIIKFMQVFSDRYNDIYRHKFCLQNPLISSEISKQIQVSLDEFMKFDSDKAKNRNYTIKSLFDSKEKELSDIEIESIPEELNTFDCVLISENDVPKPCRKSDRLGDISSFEFEEEEEEYVALESDLIQLPTIKIPDDKSIKSLISFYSTCAKGASVLPTYIGNCIINSESVKKSEKYFTKLLRIYKTVTKSSTSNKSILSNSMNDFIESFKNCVNRLKYAGANFKKILPKKIFENSQNIRVFIWIPEADPPVLPHIPWKTKDQILNPIKIYTNDTFIDLGKLHIEDISEFSDDSSDQELQIIDSSQSKIPEPNPKAPIKFSDEEKNFLLSKFVQDLSLDDNPEINNNIANENKNDDDDIINEFDFHIEPEFSQIQYSDISSEKFELISDNIKKIDNIQFILNRISKMDKNDQLELTDVINNSNYLIQNQEKLFETSIKDFPVKSLVDKTKYLVTKLIASASNCNCPFLSMSCNLLIDCSKFISNDFKIHNFMLLTAFSYALSALEIPFTISLVADQNFRFLLKSYNESISLKILQRVFDCLFIKRYRVNIADTFNYAINLLKHKERDKRAIFIFTNGLDENLILTKSWGKLILNDSNNSFGLIFLKPKILDDSKYKTIINMWDEFGKIKFVSKTKLIHIKKNLNDKIMSKVINLFADVLSHPIDSNNEIEQIQGDLKPEFVKSYDEFGEDMYLNIEKIINYKFDEHQIPIFRKINQIPKIPGTRYNKLDVHFYRNKIAKMATTQVNQLIKNKFDLFIHKNFYLERSLYRQQLEVVFKPNKASQVVLSSTGTDIDITALILNLINPVPNPLIYLEEKGGLIRNYGVSIVIDSSNSCFNQFSCIHSYQTIKVLLSGLGSIDIPFTDVIISTNDKPQILSTEIPSKITILAFSFQFFIE